ncbi:MAG: phosphopantetheine-binding protein [Holosporaceae bacterium]|jgi:acyl carrier protein|nr:phosphopantetheine-binding protein [Holosporaceae bacterium]
MNRVKLEEEIKALLIDVLELEGVSPENISSTEPLFDGNLGLDSIDGLEIGIALKKKYNIALDHKQKKYFHSVSTLVDLVIGEKECQSNIQQFQKIL